MPNILRTLKASNPSVEATDQIRRWRQIVKPGIYRMTGGNGSVSTNQNSYAMKKFIEERSQQIMNDRGQEDLRQRIELQHRGGFQPPTRHAELWTIDPFWEIDGPIPVYPDHHDRAGPSSVSTSRRFLDTRSTEDEFGTIRRSRKCPIRKDGTSSEKRRRRTK